MKSAPEKIVMLEVALVRLIKPELDTAFEALDERLTRLERDGVRAAPVAAPPEPPVVLRPIGSAPAGSPAPIIAAPTPSDAAQVSVSAAPEDAVTSSPDELDFDDVRARFIERVIPRTSRSAQLLLKAASVRSLDGQRLTVALPSEEMRQNTELINQGLRSAIDHEFKRPLQVVWTVDPTLASQSNAPAHRPVPTPRRIESGDAAESYAADETSIVVDSVADHLITEMFPGAKEMP
jgi:hypothetical protein